MKKLFYAGAVALAMLGSLSVAPAAQAGQGAAAMASGQSAAAIDVARIKSVLHLTPAQRAYWPPVEAALRRLAREQRSGAGGGLIHRISHRVVSVVLTSAAIRQLAAAARPLLARLDDGQKMAAAQLADEMGLGSVVAALN